PRDVRLITCERCGARFPAKILIDGKWRSLYRRRFCLDCSPFGAHNTSRAPLGDGPGIQHRRRERRNSSWRRYQRRRRGDWKTRLLAIRGSRCEDCGYDRDIAALEFHHRRGADKLFSIGGSLRRWEDILAEAEKCD